MQSNQYNWSLITDELTRMYVRDAYEAVNKTPVPYDFISSFNDDTRGFTFCDNGMIPKIFNNMELKDSHSGCSVGITLRNVEYIIKHGFDAYIVKCNE